MLTITPAQRRALRADAHLLNPVVMIGEAGLTPAIIKEIGMNLDAHGLIKIRVFGDDREERVGIYESICRQLGTAPIQHIGKLLVVYRQKKEEPKEQKATKGKGLRKVTIVKPVADVTRRPSVTKATIKGNQRVTKGGLVKRVKKRQASTKKSALR